MKTYILDIIPKVKQFSKKLDDLSNLTKKHWVIFDIDSDDKIVYIFKKDDQLLLLKNGKGSKESWEYIDDTSIQVTIGNDIFLFRIGFLDDQILALKLDNNSLEYSIFFNENEIVNITTIKEVNNHIKIKYLTNKENDELLYECSICKSKTQNKNTLCFSCLQVGLFDDYF